MNYDTEYGPKKKNPMVELDIRTISYGHLCILSLFVMDLLLIIFVVFFT